jgi:hypothetical protein
VLVVCSVILSRPKDRRLSELDWIPLAREGALDNLSPALLRGKTERERVVAAEAATTKMLAPLGTL